MTSTFETTLVNGLAGDPAVCVYFKQAGDSLLFDAGNLEAMTNRELLKVKVVAISHTHMDHFVGFDRLIRVNVPHFRRLEIVGPEGILKNVQGKLAGYTWNLLDQDQVSFLIHEVKYDGSIESCVLSNTNQFAATEVQRLPPKSTAPEHAVSIPLQGSVFQLNAVYVDHGMPVLAYGLSMPATMAVIKQELQASGLPPGDWISEIQKKATQGVLEGSITIAGQIYSITELAQKLLQKRPGERLVYVTDMIFSQRNLSQLMKLADVPPDVLVCEANYRREHRDRAFSKFHLTTTQAAFTAALLRAKRLQIFHISNVYGGDVETSIKESDETLSQLAGLDAKGVLAEASKEFVCSSQSAGSIET